MSDTQTSSRTIRQAVRKRHAGWLIAVSSSLALTGVMLGATSAHAATPSAQVRICTSGDKTVDFFITGVNQNGDTVTSPRLTLWDGECNTPPNGPWWWSTDRQIKLHATSSAHGSSDEYITIPKSAAGGTYTITKRFLTLP